MDKKQLQSYLQNPNIQWFLYSILKYESDKVDGKINIGGHNRTSGNSSAFGSQQFIGDTRNEILEKYGVDAWSKNLEEQQLATLALLHRGNQLENAAKGDYSNINDWEAFTEERRSRLDNRPENWEQEYETMKSDSVYDPASSWAQIPEEMKKQKKEIFDRKYSDVDFESITTNKPFDTQDKSDAYKQIDEIISGSFYADYQKDLLRKKAKKDLEGISGVKDISSYIENYNLEEEVLGRDGISSMQVDDNKNKLQEIIDDPNVSLKQKQDAQKILDDYVVRDIESLTTPPGSTEQTELINQKDTANQKAKELISELEKTKPEEAKQKVKTTQPEEIKLFKELDIEEPEEEEEVVDIELSRRKQIKALKKAGIKNAAIFDEKSKLAQFLSDNKDKINNTLNASIGLLTAAAGAKSIMQAIEKDDVAKSHVDPLFTEALQKIRAASEQGMPYEQRQAAMKDINSAYTGAMKNVMAISGGQRGMALANIGAVDANRLNSLVDLAAKDSDIRQKNLALFAQTAGQYSQQKLTADMSFEKLKSTLDMNRKNRLATIGTGLLEQAFQMRTDYTAAKTASNLISNAAGSDADRVNTRNPIYLQGFEQELDDGFENTLTIE